jgi:hypothetical protein
MGFEQEATEGAEKSQHEHQQITRHLIPAAILSIEVERWR